MSNADLQLRAVAQVALTTHITPKVRSISLDIDTLSQKITFRVYTDGAISESAQEALYCAATEIQAAYPVGWEIKEEYIAEPEPSPMQHLRLVAYARCEDSWVGRGT